MGTAPVWTELNDKEPESGSWEFTLAGELEEERERTPPTRPTEIWPHWADGVPSLLRRNYWTERFEKNRVRYESFPVTETVSLVWRAPQTPDRLKSNYGLLPSSKRDCEWSGVYRVFVEGTSIERLLGTDPTGTLYIGMAGAGPQCWSILRNRLMCFAKRDHHVAQRWGYDRRLEKRFPWKSLQVQWAFTPYWITNYKDEKTSGALTAETSLLLCYRDSFGELPPFNERI
jgi:hypothetical protein